MKIVVNISAEKRKTENVKRDHDGTGDKTKTENRHMTNEAYNAGVTEKEYAEVMAEINATPATAPSTAPQKWTLQYWDTDCLEWTFDDNHEPCSKFDAENDMRQAKRRMGGKWRVAKW